MNEFPLKEEGYELKCQGCGKEGEAWHTCPYKEDIQDDYETQCNCCEECQANCVQDI